ncbi:LysM domain-containing protein [Enterococcus haemoperoxidus ATCC BAA-382]|uniref:LysM domain-containing protein n=1 Tax=Enterococcus haemoperoxidus ATCC BAA-382 TaxID=1158608 RepID=R2QST4_9ENTE|nr:LysM domain-containing protein [Enterococcus haemoperoxidus]EOH98248.1 LysM domain-containing protein [Enterococcus haemoperoxidus ATCC BAA-382]EOT59761.1 LysM domain-containing protein [Enterococcus haemoperoxidus ATCC BAA-382]OJG55942.1 LysM domain-containing protein [Enterococcus haemoperoxidus]
MKSLKTILLATTLTAGFGIFMGTTDAHADSLYTVKSGDTLSTISHQFNGDNSLIDLIAKDNNILNVNMIFEGEELVIRTDEEATQAPAKQQAPVAAPVQETQVEEAPVAESAPVASTVAADSSSAKEWIAQKESSGSYGATNGKYIGRYQLDASYLNGDYSEANQERVADSYVAGRYGSWEAAQSFWMANGWY